jgi:hypothetical protein
MAGRSRHQALLAIEHELAAGDGDTYRRYLAEEAVVIVPGQVLTRDETIAAMDASPGWDDFSIEGERVLPLGDAAALLTYRFRGRRGEASYEAELSSVYVGGPDGPWKLAFHQQTPLT